MKPPPIRPHPRTMACLAAACLLSGCAVPAYRQRLVSKPGMQFSDSPVDQYQPRTFVQIESGSAASGGASSSGCTSCR